MIGFTLSKLNLLILVTALFSIIAFFMFSLTDIMVSSSAQQMVDHQRKSISDIGNTTATCFTSGATLPDAIKYFGGLRGTNKFYYLMYIKRFPAQHLDNGNNTLILQVASRTKSDKLVAASSFTPGAKIYLFDWTVEKGTSTVVESSSITLDPMSEIPSKDSMKIIKETYQGEDYLHIIACSSAEGVCEANVQEAGCLIKSERGRESSCFPPCGG